MTGGLYLGFRILSDPLKHEVDYVIRQLSHAEQKLAPPSTEFAVVIDKIGATSSIIKDVNPYIESDYQSALRRGVAHAQGTAVPGQGGNIFLFAHSSSDLLDAQRYNSVFYLMHHLEPGDTITVWYQNGKHEYAVADSKIVDPADTQYLTKQSKEETLTLMTCWPPGTDLKRLIVTATPIHLTSLLHNVTTINR